ncbi:MAG: MATE family efflux transporter [Spongiibacteraceae bacterium]
MPQSIKPELRTQLRIALPIFAAQLAQSANGFIDTVMAGRVSALDLASVAVGASIWVPLFLFMTGVLMSATAVLARHIGAEKISRVNPIAHQVQILAISIGVLIFLLLRSAEPVLLFMDVDPRMRPMVIAYLAAISWGFPGFAVFLALRSYTEAMSYTRPVMVVSIVGLLVNIPANYVLIYGKLGFPALGGAGCGWATSLVMWLMAAMLLVYVHYHRHYRRVPLHFWPLHWEPKTLAYLFKLGLPVGLAIFFEVSIFSVIALFISQSGAETVAGHQLSLNFTSLVFMLPLSFSLAAAARVAHARGRMDEAAVRLSIAVTLRITLTIGVVSALLLVFTRQWIPLLYTSNKEVVALASYLLLFAALYQVSDSLQVAVNGCLRGFEDTTVPMLLTLLAYWGVGLPLGYTLAMSDFIVAAMGPSGFWLGLFAGLSCAALLLGLRLRWRLRQAIC